MLFYTSPIPCAVIAAIVALHVLSVLLRGRVAAALTIVNICLHGVLVWAELVIGATLGEMTLIYGVSFLLYLSLAYFFILKREGSEDGNDV